MNTSDIRTKIRSQIKPFPRVATYPTSWGGSLTFQQIYDDLAHYVTNVKKGKGIQRTTYLPDCIQHGFMALWLELSENKDFLAQKTRQQAVVRRVDIQGVVGRKMAFEDYLRLMLAEVRTLPAV